MTEADAWILVWMLIMLGFGLMLGWNSATQRAAARTPSNRSNCCASSGALSPRRRICPIRLFHQVWIEEREWQLNGCQKTSQSPVCHH
jgi:hypothetical protein